MKAKQFIITGILLILMGVSGFAETPTLSFFGINDSIVSIPVKVEEASDSIPVEIALALSEARTSARRSLYMHQFDIRSMAAPESDADDVCIDTRGLFLEFTGMKPVKSRRLPELSGKSYTRILMK